jgi:hypothetical protein
MEEKMQEKAKVAEDSWKQLCLEIPGVFDITSPESAPCSPNLASTRASAASRVAKALRELLKDFDGADAVQERFVKLAASFHESEASLRRLQASCCTNIESLKMMKTTIEQSAEEAIRLMQLFDGRVGDMRSQLRKTIRSRAGTVDETVLCGDVSEKMMRSIPLAQSITAEDASYTVDNILSLLQTLEHDLCDQPATALQTVADEVAIDLSQVPVTVPELPRLVAACTPRMSKPCIDAPTPPTDADLVEHPHLRPTTAVAMSSLTGRTPLDPEQRSNIGSPQPQGQDSIASDLSASLRKESREVPLVRQRLNAVTSAAAGLALAFPSYDSADECSTTGDWLEQGHDQVPTLDAASPSFLSQCDGDAILLRQSIDLPQLAEASTAYDGGVLTDELVLSSTLPHINAVTACQTGIAASRQQLSTSDTSNHVAFLGTHEPAVTPHRGIHGKQWPTYAFDNEENDAISNPLQYAIAKTHSHLIEAAKLTRLNNISSAVLFPGEPTELHSGGSRATPLGNRPPRIVTADAAELLETAGTEMLVLKHDGIDKAGTCRPCWSVDVNPAADVGTIDLEDSRPFGFDGLGGQMMPEAQAADPTALQCSVRHCDSTKPALSTPSLDAEEVRAHDLPIGPSSNRQVVQQRPDSSRSADAASSCMLHPHMMHRRPATTETCGTVPGDANAPLSDEDRVSSAFHEVLFQKAALSRVSSPAVPRRAKETSAVFMSEGRLKPQALWNEQVRQMPTQARSLCSLHHPRQLLTGHLAPMYPPGAAGDWHPSTTSPLAAAGHKLVLSHSPQKQAIGGRNRRYSMTTTSAPSTEVAAAAAAAGAGGTAESTLSYMVSAASPPRSFGGPQKGMASKAFCAKVQKRLVASGSAPNLLIRAR